MSEVAWTMHRGVFPRQQDALLVGDSVLQSRNLAVRSENFAAGILLAVADGVALSPTASRASKLALTALQQTFGGVDLPKSANSPRLTAGDVRTVQQKLSEALASGYLRHGASTTLVAARFEGSEIRVVNVGDSRAYRVTVNGDIHQLSRDHTERNRMIDAGELDAAKYELASIYDALSDCLVADPEADVFAIHQSATRWMPGERLILCSDGVHDTLGDSALGELMTRSGTPHELAATIRTAILSHGAPDNFSLIIASMPAAT